MTNPTPRRLEPLEEAAYLRQLEHLRVAYTDSIKEYDRLVTWASAGALGLSITFLEKFGTNASGETAWMLATGWAFLCAAFASSLWSQYASSRIHSWRRQELDHLQVSLTLRQHGWAAKAVQLARKADWYGSVTRRLTLTSGILLVGGIMSIASFAFLNAPFKTAAVSKNTSITPHISSTPVVTEKKGLDYIPEPVPRPASTPTPPPDDKR